MARAIKDPPLPARIGGALGPERLKTRPYRYGGNYLKPGKGGSVAKQFIPVKRYSYMPLILACYNLLIIEGEGKDFED